MNGSVGTVRDICYKNKEGNTPEGDDSVYVYAIVEFPDSTVPENEAMIPGRPSTWIPTVHPHKVDPGGGSTFSTLASILGGGPF